MATKEQMAFFKSLYDEESTRTIILRGHAENNLSLSALYWEFILFVNPNSSMPFCPKILFIAALLLMLTAFIVSLMASQIATFLIPISPSQLIAKFGKSPPRNEDFFDDRIIDYADATEANAKINNKQALRLTVARVLLLVGIIVHALYFMIPLWKVGVMMRRKQKEKAEEPKPETKQRERR